MMPINGIAAWVNTTSTSLPINGLAPGTTYALTVHAVNAGGAGPNTSIAFSTLYSDTPVVTSGTNGNGSYGFNTVQGFGSMSPTKTSNGYTYYRFSDQAPIGSGKYNGAGLAIEGFTSDPGQGWLISATVAGTTETGAGAVNYTYISGTATWQWTNGPIFPGTGTYPSTIIHH